MLAYPDSMIYQLDDRLVKVNYEDNETYQIMKSFINNPKKMLDMLGVMSR